MMMNLKGVNRGRVAPCFQELAGQHGVIAVYTRARSTRYPFGSYLNDTLTFAR
jgi:hypothetical protein